MSSFYTNHNNSEVRAEKTGNVGVITSSLDFSGKPKAFTDYFCSEVPGG
jgi:hypothetical protein